MSTLLKAHIKFSIKRFNEYLYAFDLIKQFVFILMYYYGTFLKFEVEVLKGGVLQGKTASLKFYLVEQWGWRENFKGVVKIDKE